MDKFTALVVRRELEFLLFASKNMLRCGICHYVNRVIIKTPGASLYAARQWLEIQFRKWPEFSGDIKYPVTHERLEPWVAYNTLELWTGDYGATRIRLLNFLIAQIKSNEDIYD